MEGEMIGGRTGEGTGRLKVDLNRAAAEELEAIPGIGPKLARRIIEHREMHGAFRSTKEITAVPGVGGVLYERASDWLTVAPPASEVEEEVTSVSVGVESQAEVGPEKVTPEPEPAVPEEVAAPERGEVPAPAPAEAPLERYRGVGLSWIWPALLGGLLGVICTLLVLYAINGSLSLRQAPAFLEMAGQTQSLATAVADLDGRLQVLEGLPARMDAVEDTVGQMGAAVRQLNQRADTLDERVGGLQLEVEQVQKHAAKVETFFQRLQALLVEVFGMELPEPSSE